MPCDSSHMHASQREQESARVRAFLREVGQPAPASAQPDHYYGNVATLDADTAALCDWCRANPEAVLGQSLELQIWWRDHQRADEKKADEAVARARREQLKRIGLSKLTPEERKALGLD
jgi:hypothetical protein